MKKSTFFHHLDDMKARELVPGIRGKILHTDELTIMRAYMDEGAVLPEHAHYQEQVTQVLQGELKMTIDGETQICKSGDIILIPPNILHSAIVLTQCECIDVFRPARDDYR